MCSNFSSRRSIVKVLRDICNPSHIGFEYINRMTDQIPKIPPVLSVENNETDISEKPVYQKKIAWINRHRHIYPEYKKTN